MGEHVPSCPTNLGPDGACLAKLEVVTFDNIVSSDTGLIATLRRTIGQSADAIMWSLRMIGGHPRFLLRGHRDNWRRLGSSDGLVDGTWSALSERDDRGTDSVLSP
jgi:hypothetical protein